MNRLALLGAVSWLGLVADLRPVFGSTHRPRGNLELFKKVTVSTAEEDFAEHDHLFTAALDWDSRRIGDREPGRPRSYLACAEYGEGREAMSQLRVVLGEHSVHRLSNSPDQGTCFIASAMLPEAEEISGDLASKKLNQFVLWPSVLKLAPGLLDHEAVPTGPARLSSTHGYRTNLSNVRGLEVELSPGFLQTHSSPHSFSTHLRGSLMSDSLNLHASNFWTGSVKLQSTLKEGHSSPGIQKRARDWTTAADLVHGEKSKEGAALSPGGACSWDKLMFRKSSGSLILTGIDHLLPARSKDEEAKDHKKTPPQTRQTPPSKSSPASPHLDELHTACFMSLVSVLASTPEVLRVSPYHAPSVVNAVGASVVESATDDISQTPLRDAGLDGTGQVIQVIDTGLDETSCFFADGDGEEVEHGYYFSGANLTDYFLGGDLFIFEGGYFPVDLDRRKVVQYINFAVDKYNASSTFSNPFSDSTDTSSLSPTGSPVYSSNYSDDYYSYSYGSYYSYYYTSYYYYFYYYYFLPDFPGFGEDTYQGHGTHVAGSVAGMTSTTPASTAVCSGTDHLSCLGACLNATRVKTLVENYQTDWDTWCEKYNCDGSGDEDCLGKDVGATLSENGGVARGAKLSIFDVSDNGYSLYADEAENGLWDASKESGAKLHSNSWGGFSYCVGDTRSTLYDTYMHENEENLLIFAAGNDGTATYLSCSIGSPASGKNILAVGASSSGPDRLTSTGGNGSYLTQIYGYADIDTIAYFSSFGPTFDGRIKPDVVAPGDQVISASSDGTDEESCEAVGFRGTSMATPIVAGASAMVRQYFNDESFYVADLKLRGYCSDSATDATSFMCTAFSASAATVKAMLVNSANLMNGTAEPDGYRGFGRVHLEAGLPLNGEGDMALFVVDSSSTSLESFDGHKYFFDVEASTGLDLRATVAWIDPPASPAAPVMLIHDLNLKVVSPAGTVYTMWGDREDDRNVIERVIVPGSDITAGQWTVLVSSLGLTDDTQSYSLVVTGPFIGVN